MQDELNSIEEKVFLDKTISLKINNKICLAFESTTPLSISEAIQYTVDEDYHENKLYLDFYSHKLGKEVLIKRNEFFLQNMEDLAGKTFSIYLDINLYRVIFLAIIEGELNQEVDYSAIIYRFDLFQIPSEKNDTVIEIEKGATVFERGFVTSGRVTPGNNRFISSCDFCGKFFMFQMFHVGFSDVDYYYCDRCTNYLAVSIFDPKYDKLLDKLSVNRIEPFSQPYQFSDYDIQLNLENYQLIEDHFVPCTCGGQFKYLANCLCPYCKSPYVDFFNDIFRKANHYYVVELVVPKAESFYGEKYWKDYEEDD